MNLPLELRRPTTPIDEIQRLVELSGYFSVIDIYSSAFTTYATVEFSSQTARDIERAIADYDATFFEAIAGHTQKRLPANCRVRARVAGENKAYIHIVQLPSDDHLVRD